MATHEDVLRVARAEIGTKEYPKDSNNVKYNTWYYGKPVNGASYPWCCTFVCWCFSQVDHTLIKKTASCMELGNFYKARGLWKKSNPQAGDIVFFKFSTNSRWTNHVGIVESVNADGSINTIEGNTSINGSQDNGGAVLYRTRKSNIVGYATPVYITSSEYFPKCNPNHSSFVDALRSVGVNYTLEYRKKIAKANGFVEYKASAEQNIVLLNKLKTGKLLKP